MAGNDRKSYTIKGKEVTRVSTYLSVIDKPGLRNWYAYAEKNFVRNALEKRLGRKVTPELIDNVVPQKLAAHIKMDRASDRGSSLHEAIELFLKGEVSFEQAMEDVVANEEEQDVFLAWHEWWQKAGYNVVAVEQVVYDLERDYAGTADLIAEKEGKLYILDWKTGSGLAPENYLQNIAYRSAYEKMTGKKSDGVLVHVGEEMSEHPVPDTVKPEHFFAIVAAYKAMEAIPKYRKL